MIYTKKLTDEEGRLTALRRYNILDTPPEAPFDKLTELVRIVLGVPYSAVSLIDTNRQWFKSIAGLDVCETGRDISFCSHAIQQRHPMIVPDATLDMRFARNPLVVGEPHIRSYLGIPLETPDGYNLGALCALDIKPRTFSNNEVTILTSFAQLVMNEFELRQIAMIDALTSAMTRRAWLDAAEKEFTLNRRHGSDVSIIVFDIDHFKQINDVFGHPAGDLVLRTLMQRCMSAVREGDMIGRMGGEEFAILLPSTPIKGAMILAERLRGMFAETPIGVTGSDLTVTASFGVCALDKSVPDVAGWLAKADALLYKAKNAGRNRCQGPKAPPD